MKDYLKEYNTVLVCREEGTLLLKGALSLL